MAFTASVAGRRHAPLVRLLNRFTRRKMERELAPSNTVADNPGFVVPSFATTRVLPDQPELDLDVRSLAAHLVATVNGCAWRTDVWRVAAERRLPAAKLLAVAAYATDPRFLPHERAALAYAAAVTEVGAPVSNDLLAELRRHFSQRGIVELTLAVTEENTFNRIAAPPAIGAQGVLAVSAWPEPASPKA
ncbi:MAG: hypothetical protein M3Q10_13925 [Chloroflexota bacterium]|nr:hypothetical protein [Chloroflexota bacterium]